MENSDLNKIEKQVKKIDFDQDPINNLIGQIDDIYIMLDEKRHNNIFNERLCSIKSDLAKANSAELDESKRHEVFNTSKTVILELLKEASTLT